MRIGRDEKGLIAPPATSTLVKVVSSKLGKAVTGEDIFNNYEDEAIQAIYKQWLEKVAITVGNLAVCFDAEMVLIGGGISACDIFIEDLKKKVYSYFSHLQEYTLIDSCLLKNSAGKLGALYNYLTIYKNKDNEL
jgi:beta-glucoside kinase